MAGEGRVAPAAPGAVRRTDQGAGAGSRVRSAPAAEPVLVAAAGHTCLAWWHAPAAPAAGAPALPLAVVLASSWGEEDVAAYADQRALALALAEAGLGTLRFEWPDTGDSSAATGSTGIADALAAFDAAATQALARSGQERLAFVGLRLGALLAAHAAAARPDVDALVALMPVAGGRAFVGEQAVLAHDAAAPASARRPGACFDPAELPVSLGGFALPVRRLEALCALRWPAAATTAVLEALLLWPPHAASRGAADALARMGMRVHERALAQPAGEGAGAVIVDWLRERAADPTVLRGVAAIDGFGVADPGNARVQAALAAARLEAATAAVLALAAADADATAWMRLREGAVALRERVVRIADSRGSGLVGVLGERDGAATRAPRPAVVLLSADGDRRIGPHRLWVCWARRRAALGDVVLRLDRAGAGDSDPPALRDAATGSADLARVVAWLRREHGVGACTLVGVGAGGALAWRAALDGVDVQHVVAIDPATLGRPATDRGRVARLLRWARGDDLAGEIARAGARGVALDIVLSRIDRGRALLRLEAGRRAARLARDGRLTVSSLMHADPGFARPAGRQELCARLDALVRPASPAAAIRPDAWRTLASASADRPQAVARRALQAIARSGPPAA